MSTPHLVDLASPQMSTPIELRGLCSWGDEADVPAANGAIGLSLCMSFNLMENCVNNEGFKFL